MAIENSQIKVFFDIYQCLTKKTNLNLKKKRPKK